MLCLTRKTGEKIVLQAPGLDDIVVVVVGHDRGKTRLGIEAPKVVKIWREELGNFDVGNGKAS